MTPAASRKFAAEFLGTALLVATVVGSGVMAESLSAGNVAIALLGNTAATGAILYTLITIFGPVSGAHFNPAVTCVFALRRELPWVMAALFIVAQMAGGIGGAALAHAMFDLPLLQQSTHARLGLSQALSEFVATFVLVFAILGTLRTRQGAVAAVVALTVVAGYWYTASTSFANPAVTIARSFTDTFSGIAPDGVAYFVAAQFAGALAAMCCMTAIFGRGGATEDEN